MKLLLYYWCMAYPTLTKIERDDLAHRVGKSPAYLLQILTHRRQANASLAMTIHRLDSRFSLKDLRPDDWHLIWPELADPATHTQLV